MDGISPNPILEFNPNQMIEVRKLFGYEDLNRLKQDINILKDWIKKQDHFVVKEYEDKYLERHLICSKGSIERAKQHIDKLCTLRGLIPEYLQGFDIKNGFINYLKVANTCVFPKPTPDNYRLIYIDLYNPDATIFEHIDMGRYILLVIEYLHNYDYNAGIEIIFDTKNITLGILTKLSPMVVTNTFTVIQDAIGLRVKGLHYINGSKFIDTVLGIVKRGLSKKLGSRVHLHETFEELFEFIPKEILPRDIDGDMPITIKEINENNFREMSSPEFVKIVKNMEGAVTNESKRVSAKFNEDYCGMPGSFKVLSVD